MDEQIGVDVSARGVTFTVPWTVLRYAELDGLNARYKAAIEAGAAKPREMVEGDL